MAALTPDDRRNVSNRNTTSFLNETSSACGTQRERRFNRFQIISGACRGFFNVISRRLSKVRSHLPVQHFSSTLRHEHNVVLASPFRVLQAFLSCASSSSFRLLGGSRLEVSDISSYPQALQKGTGYACIHVKQSFFNSNTLIVNFFINAKRN